MISHESEIKPWAGNPNTQISKQLSKQHGIGMSAIQNGYEE